MTEPQDLKEAHFEFALRREGFAVERKVQPPARCVPEHAHPFDVRALVLNGDITLTVEGIDYTYRVGDIFVMPAGHRHAETVGPEGVEYLVGRRAVDAARTDAATGDATAHAPLEAMAARNGAGIEPARA
ncbi:MAG TPA: cupin domain-containing protein [Casimicrobiaceae bacterium]|jgi:quercetin dioxygenase-like cupin family protein|nr:cupin domain-containing protein [Casimicrobiaceae bacterium]